MKAVRSLACASLAVLALAGCSSATDESSTAPSSSQKKYENGQKATVKTVDSGNTVTVDIDGVQKQVRLVNVVAPSENNNVPSGTCLIAESKKFLADKLPEGKEVTLKFDPAQIGSSGFLESAVYVGDDFINKDVVGVGMAATTFTTAKDKFYPEISQAQQQAAEDGKGLYSKDVECTIPHQIEQALDEAKSASDIKDEDERKATYRKSSQVYNDLDESISKPATYVGSIVTLDAVRDQMKELRDELGDHYYDEKGETVADKASASASASARPGQ